MRLLKFFVKIAGVMMGITLFLFVVNLLQKGSSAKDGRSMSDILGKEAEKAEDSDLLKLKKADLMQLFYAAPAPELAEMNGEFRSEIIPAGVLGFAASFFADKMFGPGSMVGKGFCQTNDSFGWGYNIFHFTDIDGKPLIARTRKAETYIDSSRVASDGDSFHLSYNTYNAGLVKSMHSEVRKINKTLYIGMVYLGAAGGAMNPTPFTLVGPPSEFQGPDS